MPTKKSKVYPPINPNDLYSLQDVKDRLGVGEKLWNALKRRGLEVHRVGTRGFVLGRNLIEVITGGATNGG